jgi:hypothetical protein
MPRGQFYTVFTLGFATAIGLMGIVAGIALLFWHEPTWRAVAAAHGQLDWLSPLYFSLFVASSALLLAYWIVRIQQALVRWSGDRAIAKLNREYNEIARRLGPDQADEFVRLQSLAMLQGPDAKRFDLFGREEMLQGMAAAGVKVPAR